MFRITPPFLGQEVADGFPGAEERAFQVDIENAFEFAGFDFVAGTRHLNPGVIYQHIDRAKRVEHFGEHGLHLVFPGDIGLHDEMFAGAGFFDQRQRGFGFRLIVVIVDGDVRAFFGEPDRNRLADTGRCAGDQGVLSLQSQHAYQDIAQARKWRGSLRFCNSR